jgi:hypothetical protein
MMPIWVRRESRVTVVDRVAVNRDAALFDVVKNGTAG